MSAPRCSVEGCRAAPGLVVLEADGVRRCLTHAQDAVRVRRREERNVKGGFGRVQGWPSDVKMPPFPKTLDDLPRWGARVSKVVLAGKVDPRLVAEARNLAQLSVIQPRTILAQEQLAEALLRLEHGGIATALLAKLIDGDPSRRRPLPERPVRALPSAESEATS